ncbi:MAG: hypothetical protein ACFFDY_08515 [Candidatus Thorarchaeota archaeon]
MDPKDDEKELEKLSNILSKIQDIYYKKKEQLEELKTEILELREVINYLNSLLTGKSFQSADEIYSKSLIKAVDIPDEEQYFVEEVSKEKVKGTNIKRKIFSKSINNDEELLAILNFYDFNRVEIKIIEPEKRSIRESSEDFVRIFIKGALVEIKEKNPNISREYGYYKNSELIETISVSNLKSIKDYDIITSKMRELLAKEVRFDN